MAGSCWEGLPWRSPDLLQPDRRRDQRPGAAQSFKSSSTRAHPDKELRTDVETALEYQRRIEVQVRQQNRPAHPRPAERHRQPDHAWIANMYALALRLDAYRRDDLLDQQHATAAPKSSTNSWLEQRKKTSEAVQAQLDGVIDSKGKQWQALRDLDDRMKQAALQLEQSLTALATIYSQIQLVDAQSVESGRAERLQPTSASRSRGSATW